MTMNAPTPPTPTVGRVVYYYDASAPTLTPVAAFIAEIHDATGSDVTLFLLDAPHQRTAFVRVQYAPSPTPGYWTWPMYQGASSHP